MQSENKLKSAKKSSYKPILIGIIVLLCVLFFSKILLNDLFERIELKSYDWKAHLSTINKTHDKDIVLLLFDDISFQNALSHPNLNLGRWPWPRSVHGDIVRYLNRCGAKAIIFDIIFEGHAGVDKQSLDSDQYFIESIKGFKNVYSAVAFTYSSKNLKKFSSTNFEIFKNNIMSVSTQKYKKYFEKFSFSNLQIMVNDIISFNIEYNNVSNILPGILTNVKAVGSVTLPESFDGINREIRPIVKFNGKYYPSLPLAAYHGIFPNSKLSVQDNVISIDGRKIELSKEGTFLLNWYGPAMTFKHFRALDVILAQKSIDSGKSNPLNPEVFKDKIVIIGLSATTTDILPTPMGGAYPGPEIIATTINNFIDSDRFVKRIGIIPTLIAVFLLCILTSVVIYYSKSGIIAAIISTSALFLYITFNVYIFTSYYLWLDLIYPSFCLILTIFMVFIIKYMSTRQAFEDTFKMAILDEMTGLFNHRYFQESMRASIAHSIRYKEPMSLLFIDVDYFKKINDTYGHRAGDDVLKELARRLKSSLRTTDIICRYGGEEIAVIMDNTNLDQAHLAAQKVSIAINSKAFKTSLDVQLNVSVSIGISNYPIFSDKVEDLIEYADQGLYQAKHDGRNCIRDVRKSLSLIKKTTKDDSQKGLILVPLQLESDVYDYIIKDVNSDTKEEVTKWIIDTIKQRILLNKKNKMNNNSNE